MRYYIGVDRIVASGEVGAAAWIVYVAGLTPSDDRDEWKPFGKWVHWKVRRVGREDTLRGMEDSAEEAVEAAMKQAAIMAGTPA
jgi:hypothetical protein